MTELKIADQDMYGYRTTGPHEPDTRVRVIAGTEIPPDLHSLEPTKDFKDQDLYPDVTAARATAEDQQALQDERNAGVRGYADDAPGDSVVDVDAAVSRGTRRERQIRSGAIPTPDAPADAGESKDDLVKRAKELGVSHSGSKADIQKRIDEAEASS